MVNNKQLKNKVVIVSGGSRGIGRAICELFSLQGARVAVNYSEEADRDYPDSYKTAMITSGLLIYLVQ
tara:strand:+ start:91 stop:294 length:204 start_codon:yes stop_codon:yes gene_type:complete